MKDDWIITYTGKKFYPTNPNIDDIDIIDIAHALSMKCRFSGHTKHFYSVAQHSTLASEIIDVSVHSVLFQSKMKLVALLHDASEAYLPDIPRPVKRSISKNNKLLRIDQKLQEMIYERFGVDDFLESDYVAVKIADNILLYTEGRDLMKGGVNGWHDADNIIPLKEHIDPMYPTKAKIQFLETFYHLMKEKNGISKSSQKERKTD